MKQAAKQIVVVIACQNEMRIQEALRAAIGVGLRGDKILVFHLAPLPDDAPTARLVATLKQLKIAMQPLTSKTPPLTFDAVEVWTDSGVPAPTWLDAALDVHKKCFSIVRGTPRSAEQVGLSHNGFISLNEHGAPAMTSVDEVLDRVIGSQRCCVL